MSRPRRTLACIVAVAAVLLSAIVSAAVPSTAWAAPATVTGTTIYSSTNVRSGPSTSSAVVGRVSLGTSFTGTSANGWLHLTTGPYSGKYVALSTLKLGSASTSTPTSPTTTPVPTTTPTPSPGTVNRRTTAASTNVRAAASLSAQIVARVPVGTVLTGTLSGGWLHVTAPAAYSGRYVSGSVLVNSATPAVVDPTPPGPVYALKAPYTCASNPLLSVGKSNDAGCTRSVQYVLNSWILRTNTAGTHPMTLSGTYDALTSANVTAFQRANGIAPSGNVDPATWQALSTASQATGAVTTDRIIGAAGDTHPAFPSAIKLEDGRLMIVFTSAKQHLGNSTPSTTWKTYSSDGGYTWSSPEQITFPNAWENTPAGLGIASSGPLKGHPILTTWSVQVDAKGSKTTHTLVTVADDTSGTTWGPLLEVRAVNGNNFSASPIVQISDVEFQQAVYVYAGLPTTRADTVGLTLTGAALMIGATSTIATATDGSSFSEVGMVKLPDGRLLALIRNDPVKGQPANIYSATSSDGGRTWGPATVAFPGGGAPRVGTTPDGKLVVLYRHASLTSRVGDADAVYRVSTDNGATWGPEQTVGVHSPFEMAYGTPVANADNTVTFVFASEASGSSSQIVVAGNVPVK